MFVFCLATVLPVRADLSVSPVEWNFETSDGEKIIETEITIHNKGGTPVTVSLIETCDCFYPAEKEIKLEPGGRRTVRLRFDPRDDRGAVEKNLIIQNADNPRERIFFNLRGEVTGGSPGAAGPEDRIDHDAAPGPEAIPDKQVTAFLYYSVGCKTCQRLLDSFFPSIEKKLQVRLSIIKKDIDAAGVLNEYADALSTRGLAGPAFPSLIVGDAVLRGEGEIRAGLEGAVARALSGESENTGGNGTDSSHAEAEGVLPDLFFLPVFLAGLGDGINPCAFSTLIFLIVSLSYVGKKRKAVLVTGIFFTIGVFITYYLIGLGLFHILRTATFFPVVSKIIDIVLLCVLVVFAGLSVYDFILIRRGRAREMVLQLPKILKKLIHKSVRTYLTSVALVSGALLLGGLVSIFELACTGQIYLPVIRETIRNGGDGSAWLMLAVYNIAFIIPLLGVFVLVYTGVSSEKITLIFQKNMGAVKILLALVFLMLAAMIVFISFV